MVERSDDCLGKMLDGLRIEPPKLEDAGLEDCALPPHSIFEAFSRAAKSRAIDDDHDDEVEIQVPRPVNISGNVGAMSDGDEGGDDKGGKKPYDDDDDNDEKGDGADKEPRVSK